MTAVILPWRPTEGRRPAYELTRAFYRATLPDAPIFEVDTPHEQFNLGACRNKGVVKAQEIGHEVVVISDADTIPDAETLHRTIAAAEADQRLHYPFDQCIYSGFSARSGPANGGVIVMQTAAWDFIEGQDERAVGWGSDDDTLAAAATCLIGVERHPGLVVSMWHPDACRASVPANARLAQRYWNAVGSPRAMRAILAEPGRRA